MDIQTGQQKTASGSCEKIIPFYVGGTFSSLVVHLGYTHALIFVCLYAYGLVSMYVLAVL